MTNWTFMILSNFFQFWKYSCVSFTKMSIFLLYLRKYIFKSRKHLPLWLPWNSYNM
jgi:hypothetical protein